jgi:hypothetical protein
MREGGDVLTRVIPIEAKLTYREIDVEVCLKFEMLIKSVTQNGSLAVRD